jgi:hypothetical protein
MWKKFTKTKYILLHIYENHEQVLQLLNKQTINKNHMPSRITKEKNLNQRYPSLLQNKERLKQFLLLFNKKASQEEEKDFSEEYKIGL